MAARVKYPREQREQILKEAKETGNLALVARKHAIAYQTVAAWARAERKAPARKKKQARKDAEARVQDLELENQILKELLKKTNQLWLSDGRCSLDSSPRGTV